MATEALTVHAVILAGGRGNALLAPEPHANAQQLLNIIGKQTCWSRLWRGCGP